MDEEVEHVIVEGEADSGGSAHPEAISDAAAVAVATAGAAAALASETAAHAELQAAEEVAEIEQEQDAWRTATASQMVELGQTLATMSESVASLHSRAEENAQTQTALLERLLRLEEAELSRQSTLEPSEPAETVEERTAEAPLIGTEAAANLGPIAAEAGGGISSDSTEKREPPNPNANARPRVLRRWI